MTINGDRESQVEQVFYFRWCLVDAFLPLSVILSKLDPANFTLNNKTALSDHSFPVISMLFIPFSGSVSKRCYSGDILCRILQHWLRTDGSR